MYLFLDYFLLVTHSTLVLFILSGWIWARTRRLHLAATLLTWSSWVGLGFQYGFGYCVCTDWHWQIKRRLGETHLPNSYIKYYLDRLTGVDWDRLAVDGLVFGCAATALGLSLWLNARDWRRARSGASADGTA